MATGSWLKAWSATSPAIPISEVFVFLKKVDGGQPNQSLRSYETIRADISPEPTSAKEPSQINECKLDAPPRVSSPSRKL